jgi:hypothetical protein
VKVDLRSWELHNIVHRGDELRTRKTLASLKTPTGGTNYVGGFTIESPNTTEPWHYLFEQDANGFLTLRVVTEEFFELFNLPVGVVQRDPVISHGEQNMQGLINSPAFATALYFLVGGGVVTATKTVSDTSVALGQTVIDIPAGHVCAFGDRLPIASGKGVYFNDPGTDPRTYVSENIAAIPALINDAFQGKDGAYYLCTTQGVYSLPQDALGQGQAVVGSLSRLPNVDTMRSRNAVPAGGGAAVLQRDRVLLIEGTQIVGEINLSPYDGRRYFSKVVDVDDLRLRAELFPSPEGFAVGFRGSRGHFCTVNTTTKAVTYVTSTASALNLVGLLRTRNGETLYVLKDRIVAPMIGGLADFDGATVRGVACGRLALPAGTAPVVRHVTIGAANQGAAVGAFVSGVAATKTTPTKVGENIIGTSVWSATTKYAGRETRNTRIDFGKRTTEPHVEVVVDAGDVRINPFVDITIAGQGEGRPDKT